ncbi:MAG: glycosyltransferase family 2 protein [Muribaculaceae bacterium]|nr:glycosyltransferase family 2 protein [Muribaculaceae bacterium]
MTDIKVSILLPIYKVENYVERCVTSVFEQTYENIEIIIVNDCTPDKSMDIVMEVLRRYPSVSGKVTIIANTQNEGISETRNIAVNRATGDFILFVDSDDWIDRNLVCRLVAKQKASNADIVSTDYIIHYDSYEENILNTDIESPKELIKAILTNKEYYRLWGRLILTSLYRDNNIKAQKGIDNGDDLQVFPQLIFFSNKCSYLHEFLYNYDYRNPYSYSNTFSHDKSLQSIKSIETLYDFFAIHDRSLLNVLEIKKADIILSCMRISVARKESFKYFARLASSIKWKNIFKCSVVNVIAFLLHNRIFIKYYNSILSKLRAKARG